MTARHSRPDVLEGLRPAREELERINARGHHCYQQARTAFDGSVYDNHTYLSAYLEAAHAHMVGEKVARTALQGTLGRPLPRESWRRDEAEYQFDRTLSEFAYHHQRFSSDVDHVTDWIRQFGRPAPPGAQLVAEQEAER